ncbi:fluoride efflux transporter CrcB [Telmatospirillum sp. J64-1]|uniref:fluoride efflux transporter CrcB n=1 Tax=Telmatospirillum sp. J64-1 TaxID=2502183 RepID=UPI00115E1265|nr:fluoride efflux transporter CrcB [Telmatospirillum sp. J64-1]
MTSWLIDITLIALGGALGGMARFWVSGLIARRYGEDFPWGTLTVNVTGAALIGIVAALLLGPTIHHIEHPRLWVGLVVGILGSYTTVSSFSLQTLALLRAGRSSRAALNVIASLTLCLLAAGAAHAITLALSGRN